VICVPTRVGTDIVAVARIEQLVRTGGETFLRRWFTPAEISYCAAKTFPSRHLAARLAAKEAVVKGLRLAWDGPVPYHDVEIVSGDHGAPFARLSGRLQELAAAAGVRDVQVSLSHCDEYATAVALVEVVDT
jgi:holo-[acyl-carrier protein] synthase